MKEELRLLVVIINYKTPKLVCNALCSLEQQVDINSDRVVVVDNASNDGSVNEIVEFVTTHNWNNWVDVIPSNVNGGFSAGNNIGIKSAKAKYYLLLNSDAFVRDNAIKIMIREMELNVKAGIVGPKLEWENGEQQVSCFYNLTPWTTFLNVASTGFLTKLFYRFGVNEVAISVDKSIKSPEWISFACVLIRNEAIQSIGLMDEGFFMYMEDVDYCRRVRKANWDISFCDGARVVHLNQGYSNNLKIRRLPNYYYRSRARYFMKYYGRLGFILTNILWYLGRFISINREFLESKEKKVPPYSYRDIWLGFWQSINKNG
jgi:N-acetylglucosaminyl-diphospho-decaprenol L-rhamnosyltransferase